MERVTGVALHPVTYPNGDVCQYLNIWFRCRAVGGQAQVNDDESLAVAWFAADSLPEIDELARLRIEVALNDDNAAWFAKPGEYHKALT